LLNTINKILSIKLLFSILFYFIFKKKSISKSTVVIEFIIVINDGGLTARNQKKKKIDVMELVQQFVTLMKAWVFTF
jgi:uncharacterized membrane protein YcaP (DUF421 family)